MARLGSEIYVMGGQGVKTTEVLKIWRTIKLASVWKSCCKVLEASLEDTWFAGPELPTVLSRCDLSTLLSTGKQRRTMILFRSCAVSTGSSIIMVGGHNNQSTESLNIMLEMTKVNVQKKFKWVSLAWKILREGREDITAVMQDSCQDCECLFKI